MKVILFDLDFTLANTLSCQPYLTSVKGREEVLNFLSRSPLEVSGYGKELIESFNAAADKDFSIAVVSDSPKNYCIKVLECCGYKIDSRLVFGNQKKPLVDFDSLKNSLADVLGVGVSEMNFLVVGDSPKDIYFAHQIRAPSVFAAWGTRYPVAQVERSQPSRTASNFQQLKNHIDDFLHNKLGFVFHDFYQGYNLFDPDFLTVKLLGDESVGYAREYVPYFENYRDSRDKYSSLDLRQIVKHAKNYEVSHHQHSFKMKHYGSGGFYDTTRSLKSLAGIYKRDFVRWLNQLGVHGTVLLVPVPPSVPQECNLSNPVALISEWWSGWVSDESDNIDVVNFDVFRRIVPKQSSHSTQGRRHMDDQFPTLGVEHGSCYKGVKVNYVIILDDVVTSGSHMNAIASIISSTSVVPGSPKILGYALFKTVHPENDSSIDSLIDFSFLE